MLGRWLAASVIAALLTASALLLLGPMAAEAATPNQPTNESPANGTSDISLTHTFQSSPFSDPDEVDTHYASQWQITAKSKEYSSLSLVFDSGVDTSNLIKISISSGVLSCNTTYYWHVRHQDNHGWWSSWSTETSFKTIVSGKPGAPDNMSPANGTTHISLIPTLKSSAFVSLNGGATHAASQWQITAKQGDYSSLSLVFDSGVDTSNQTSIAIPPGVLSCNTTYYWHVQHQDSYGNWSSWSIETSFKTVVSGNPGTPVNISPANGTTDILLTPTLQSTAFISPDGGATHAASQWQITTISGDYTSPVFDSGIDTSNQTSITIPSGSLSYNIKYYWRIRHQDSYGNWSAYSEETSFTTIAARPPVQPTAISPSVAATNISLTPTLSSSDFSSAAVGATHAASQWQITTKAGDYSSPVYDSGVDTVNLTRITMGQGYLNYSTTYYWHVRYQDSYGNWSAYSEETSFTTMAVQPPRQPTNISPSFAAINVSLTPTLRSSAFSSADAGATHAASQWQITTKSGDYSSPVYDSGVDTANLTRIIIGQGYLNYGTTYYWHVRHQDSYGNWSDYSGEGSFTTTVAQPPKQPTTVSPRVAATNISLTPILQSSAFSGADVGVTHAASQWQITTKAGDYSSPVYDSGVDTANLTRITIGQGYLNYGTTYYWHVRHQDSQGIWSDYSSEASFTTAGNTKTSFSDAPTKSANTVGLPWVWIVLGIVVVIGGLGVVIVRRRHREA